MYATIIAAILPGLVASPSGEAAAVRSAVSRMPTARLTAS